MHLHENEHTKKKEKPKQNKKEKIILTDKLTHNEVDTTQIHGKHNRTYSNQVRAARKHN